MENMMKAGLVVIALTMTIFMQVYASRRKSTILGLILPMLIFLFSMLILIYDMRVFRAGVDPTLTRLHIVSDFAICNVPTILFLCIYNYYQRNRLMAMR